MIPHPGQFFASRSDSLIGEAIQKAELLHQKRMHHLKDNDVMFNHIGGFIMHKGILCVAEALTTGFTIHPWIGSEYQTKKTEYIILELYKPFDFETLLKYTKTIESYEGCPYDFVGIIDSLDFAIDGRWNGEINQKAQDKMFCSEAIATGINEYHKGIFPYPWCVSPQLFIENTNLVVIKNQPFYEKS